MITISPFNDVDNKEIARRANWYKIYLKTFSMLFIPLSFLVGLFGLKKNGFGYWPTTVCVLILFAIPFIYLIIKDNINYRGEKRSQLKYAGIITVVKKIKKRKDFIVYTDFNELKKIEILSLEAFNQIEVGDRLYIELTKFSKYILKLEKNSTSLLNDVLSA